MVKSISSCRSTLPIPLRSFPFVNHISLFPSRLRARRCVQSCNRNGSAGGAATFAARKSTRKLTSARLSRERSQRVGYRDNLKLLERRDVFLTDVSLQRRDAQRSRNAPGILDVIPFANVLIERYIEII